MPPFGVWGRNKKSRETQHVVRRVSPGFPDALLQGSFLFPQRSLQEKYWELALGFFSSEAEAHRIHGTRMYIYLHGKP